MVEVIYVKIVSRSITMVMRAGIYYIVPSKVLRKAAGRDKYIIDQSYLNENNIVRDEDFE